MNRVPFTLSLLILLFISSVTKAQLKPQDAIKEMMRGINIGNTMEPPQEGGWGNPALKQRAFDDYKNAGFTAIRIPITWDAHVATTSPYTITKSWLDRVDTVVTWGLKRGLLIIINAHHEAWIKNSYTDANKARFDSIWSQIATRFKNKSDSLMFEIINEPNPILQANIDDLNKRTLKTIRKTNPTRIVLFSGMAYSNSPELISAAIPDTSDKYLMGYYHSYDPYPFGLNGPGTYGSATDIAVTKAKFDQVTAWSVKNKIPVILGEYGYQILCDYNSRMCAYATVVDQSLTHVVAPFAWDDGGSFPIYNRSNYGFNEIKDILIHTYKESPNHMIIDNYADTLVQILWTNRTTENDSIIIERRIGNAAFTFYKKVSPTTSAFIDSGVQTGKSYYYRLRANLKDSIEIQSYPVMINNAFPTLKPYSGKPINVPGTVEAENFDKGMEGLSYHDFEIQNLGGAYRLGVGTDIYAITGTSYNYVGNVHKGEWMKYTVNVKQATNYKITAYVAAIDSGGEFNLQFSKGTTPLFTAPSTGSLSVFNTVSNTIQLDTGVQVMQLNILGTPEFSIDRLVFSFVTSVNENSLKDISLYPNPFINKINISGVDGPALVEIYNSCGILINSLKVNGNFISVPLGTLNNGFYILKYTNANTCFSKKIIKKSN